MIFIDESTSRELLTRSEITEAVSDALIALYSGQAGVFPVSHGHSWQHENSFSMKAGQVASLGAVGLKVGSYWPSNQLKGRANHNSAVLLLDPGIGCVQALVSTSYLNGLRTAAANGLAVRKLARRNARTLGIVGAGHQAYFEARAVGAEREIESIRIWSRDVERASQLAGTLERELGISARSETISAVCGCDIVVTATSANSPLVQWKWINPGSHISAMGADQVGKRELARPYPSDVRLFADFPPQSIRIGEFQGLPLEPTALGALLAGAAPGRTDDSDITVFDSSGLAIQDLAVAKACLRRYVDRSHSSLSI